MLSHLVMFDSLQPYGLLAHQAPLSMRFSQKEYWSRLPFSSLGDLPDLGIEPCLLRLLHCSGFFAAEPPGNLHVANSMY